MKAQRTITVQSLAHDAAGLFGLAAPVLLPLAFIFLALPNLFDVYATTTKAFNTGWLLLPLMILSTVGGCAMYAATLSIGTGGQTDFKTAVAQVLPDLPILVALTILSSFAVLSGLMLLIVPGFILNAWLALVYCVRLSLRLPLADCFGEAWRQFRIYPAPLLILLSALLIPHVLVTWVQSAPPLALQQHNGEASLPVQIIGSLLNAFISVPEVLVACAYFLRTGGTQLQRTANIFE